MQINNVGDQEIDYPNADKRQNDSDNNFRFLTQNETPFSSLISQILEN